MSFEREPTEDEVLGIVWWNQLTERARSLWLQRAQSTMPAPAWALFQSDPGISFEIGLQEGQELARANEGGTSLGADSLALYGAPAGPTRH
jgi:hypothetical protein